jgi:DNA-binding helix-hairpin-helix protein with protein kinase domain
MTTLAPRTLLHDAAGTAWTLGAAIGAGGEGTVHAVDDDPGLVAKIYAEPPGPDQVAKLDAMVATGDASLRRVAAWPSAVLHAEGGPAGFLMPRLASQLPLHELFGPRRRQELFPDAHWSFLVHAALNVASAFEAMHERDIVVGDVNSNNVVIHATSKTRFIDCDSFQIRRDGRLFRCTVGVPEYQPPELQTADLGTAERLPQHDLFGLAVMVFQLLFVGKHPFAGILPPHLTGDATIGANIGAGHFFYAPGADREGLRPPPGSLALSALPEAIEALFHRAFLGDPAGRPSAGEWREALRALESDTAPCERSRRHRYVRGVACPWCALEQTGLFYFAPRPEEVRAIDETAWTRFSDGEVERTWREIAPPPPLPDPIGVKPRRPPADALLALLAAPVAAIAVARNPALRAQVRERRARVDRLQAAFRARYARWRELAQGRPFAAELERLAAVRAELLNQRGERERELDYARAVQARLDHATFLAQFPIPRVPQVPGSLVTPSGPTTGIENRQMRDLARYGITNATHCTLANLRAVPHLRSWRIDVLVEWRMALDAQFAALPKRELEYKVRHGVEVRFARTRDTLRTELLAGVERLRQLAADLTREGAELAAQLPAEAAELRHAQAEAATSPLFFPRSP